MYLLANGTSLWLTITIIQCQHLALALVIFFISASIPVLPLRVEGLTLCKLAMDGITAQVLKYFHLE